MKFIPHFAALPLFGIKNTGLVFEYSIHMDFDMLKITMKYVLQSLTLGAKIVHIVFQCSIFSSFFLQIGEHINKTMISERGLYKNPAERKKMAKSQVYAHIKMDSPTGKLKHETSALERQQTHKLNTLPFKSRQVSNMDKICPYSPVFKTTLSYNITMFCKVLHL